MIGSPPDGEVASKLTAVLKFAEAGAVKPVLGTSASAAGAATSTSKGRTATSADIEKRLISTLLAPQTWMNLSVDRRYPAVKR